MNALQSDYKTFHTQQSITSNYSLYLLKDLTSTAKYLYIEMRRIAGVKGYLSCPVDTLSDVVGRSIKQTRRLLHELESNDLLEIWLHSGHESEYIIKDVYFRQGMDINGQSFKKKNLKIKSNVMERPNVIFLQPQEEDPCPIASDGNPSEITLHTKNQKKPLIKVISNKKPVRMDVVREILDLTKDTKSIGCWIKFVRSAPLPIVYAAIASLKSALDEGIVQHPGRYMVGVIKNIFPELFSTQSHALRQPQEKIDVSIYSSKPYSEDSNPVDIDWSLNNSSLKNIQAILKGKMS